MLAALALTLSACTGPTVVRVIDGREVPGRFVASRAYALYARGADSEARGDLDNARLEYLAAAAEDPANAEIWTRIGAVSCALARAADAQSAFARAAERAPDYEPLHRERAACALSRAPAALPPAEADAALRDARTALALDPTNEDTALLLARAAEAAGRPALAEKALRELVARAPGRAAGWRALLAFARRHDDPPAAARAAQALRDLGTTAPDDLATHASAPAPAAGAPPAPSATAAPNAAAPAAPRPDPAALLADVDAALARDALDDARTAAKRARLPPAELAVRAAALGRATLARTQAQLVFAADPASASAAIALAIAADLLRDDPTLLRALADASARTTPPSPLARLLLAELLHRRVDAAAARAYLGALPPVPPDADPLLRAVTARLAPSLVTR